MRIAYITVALPGVSSGESFFLPEIRRLVERGYALTLVPREVRGARSQAVESELTPIAKIVGLGAPGVWWALVRSTAYDFKGTIAIIRECCLDGPWLTRLKNLRVLPKGIWLGEYVRRHSISHIHAQWGATTATLAEIAHRVSGVPWSFTLHRGDILENNGLLRKVKSAAFTRFISSSGLALYRSVTGHDARVVGNVKIIHMGVAIPAEGNRAVRLPGERFNIVCPANLVPVKGHVYLLEAVEIIRQESTDVHLYLAGDGPIRPELEAWARRRGLTDHVTFMGHQEHYRLLDAYRARAFDAAVLASIDLGRGVHEGIPVALMECMAFGIPVISTDTGGIPELLHGGAGLIVPPQDSGRLASAIRTLITDGQLAEETANRGRERVIAEFNVAVTTILLSEAFEESKASVGLLEQTESTEG